MGEESKEEGRFDAAASVGLFIGINSFEDERFRGIPFAVDDAVDLAHRFLDLGLIVPERTTLLLAGEPRKPESAERLERLVERGVPRRTARQRDIYRFVTESVEISRSPGIVIVAVATHGMSDQGGDFLVATDSLLDRTLRTGVPVSDLFADLAKAGALRRLVLLDACREQLAPGTRGRGDSAMARSFSDAITSSPWHKCLW